MTKLSAFLTARFGKLDATGKFWMWAGIITLICSMGMAYDYGSQVTWKHGLVMGALSFATAFLLEEAYSYWKRGLTGVAIGLTIVSIPMFWQETKSHIAYTAGFRTASVEKVKVQNTKYNGAQDDVNKLDEQIAFWTKRRSSLIEQNGWTATVTADALRARLDGMNLAIKQEEARGGCKAKCLDRTKERDEVASRIAVLEETKGLDDRIKQANDKLAELRTKAGAIEHQTSIVEHQTDFLQKAVAFALNKGDSKASPTMAEGVDIENTIMLALMPVMLPALCFFMMGLRRQDDEHAAKPASSRVPPVDERFAPPPAATADQAANTVLGHSRLAVRSATLADLRSSLRSIAA